MAEIHCPICDRLNDANAERCWYCQGLLPHEPAATASNAQDWLEGLRDDSDASAPDENSSQPAQPDAFDSTNEEIPDWLARIREREHSEHSSLDNAADSDSSENTQGEIPDWLNDLKPDQKNEMPDTVADTPGSETPSAPKTESPSSENEEDWLKNLEDWQPNADYQYAPPKSNQPEANPDTSSSENGGNVSDESAAESQPIEELAPDWLQSIMHDSESKPTVELPHSSILSSAEPAKEENINAEPPLSEPESTSKVASPSKSEEPDQPAVGEEKSSAATESETTSTPAEEPEGNWLSAFKGIEPGENLTEQVIPPANNDNQAKSPFNEGSLMDWLAPEENPVIPSSEKITENESEQNIEPAALPPWLQALRPKQIEPTSAAQTASTSDSESFGPLAGIEGALQGEEVDQVYARPQTYSEMVKVSENQQIRSEILKNVMGQTAWKDESLNEKTSSTRWIIHMTVVLLMLAAAFIPTLFSGIPKFLPALYPEEVVQTFNAVNALPLQKPVLVAADFDGSLYGELNLTLQPLFTQIIEKNISIAFLSTNPVGATLMAKSLTGLAAQTAAYSYASQVVNLGYLAGGSIGLQSLAQNPVSTMPLDSNLQPAWQSGPLQSVKKLTDFGALIVVTENADTARYWIEQVQPKIGNIPMIVVISSQSAPLLQPYYDSGQIKGYLSGLNAAAVYEILENNPLTALADFSAYQVSLLLVAFLILVGGIVSLILYRPSAERKQGKKV